ncbi:ABC transporter ATP-binding protein [Microbispora sp. KK1-11]|uniref:ABC transporter ATP-binding protein n=1 Tax=Microbispora sp. KK1-11 TaxID=2053005 RepID=UPI001157573B|nr:ABC transporter ATP-binding protein [Microbispora sp. KK1-11]TQS19095.1 ABC transporter ATP-binding protein [Microbispora sp. KK1-11]
MSSHVTTAPAGQGTAVLRLSTLVRLAPLSTVASAALSMTTTGAALLAPAVAARAVDEVLAGAAGLAVLALLGLLTVRALTEAFFGIVSVSATTRIAVALRYRLLRHVFALGVPGMRRHATGDLVARLTGNTYSSATAVPDLVGSLVTGVASLGGLIALWLIDWRIGAVFMVGAIPAVLLLRRFTGQVTGAYAEYLEHQATVAARLTDALAGSRTIRASGTAQREIDRVLGPLPDLNRAGTALWKVQGTTSWQVGLVVTGVRVLVLVVAGLGVTGARLSPGEFLATALYLPFALGLLGQVETLSSLASVRANMSRIRGVLAERPHVRYDAEPCPARCLPPGPGALSFRKVAVRHDDRTILEEVDLDLPAGASVALVGRSGTGKSTLALLAGRLVDPDEGQVMLDGVPVDSLHPTALRREVAYAFDRPVLLGTTVRDALTYGRPDTTEPAIEHAAWVARATDFIRRLPEGLDTPLTAVRLSGGELQRLGLARAVAQGGRVLVLDDATSSLDTVTEAQVSEAITEGLACRTRLIVAHRAATAARADLVAWLDEGRIRAVAPHTVLWASEPDYRAVFAIDTHTEEVDA